MGVGRECLCRKRADVFALTRAQPEHRGDVEAGAQSLLQQCEDTLGERTANAQHRGELVDGGVVDDRWMCSSQALRKQQHQTVVPAAQEPAHGRPRRRRIPQRSESLLTVPSNRLCSFLDQPHHRTTAVDLKARAAAVDDLHQQEVVTARGHPVVRFDVVGVVPRQEACSGDLGIALGPVLRDPCEPAPRRLHTPPRCPLAEDARRAGLAVETALQVGDGAAPRGTALEVDGAQQRAGGVAVKTQHRPLEDAAREAPHPGLRDVDVGERCADSVDGGRGAEVVQRVESRADIGFWQGLDRGADSGAVKGDGGL